MANIIDSTYFFGPLAIAQIEQPSVQAEVNDFIAQYETEFLRALLTPGLYTAYIAGVQANTDEYLALKNGADFSWLDGSTLHFNGLVYTEGDKHRSPIANYVYCRYQQHNRSVSTGTGEKELAAQNATNISVAHKVVAAWNDMVQQNEMLVRFIVAKGSAVYPGWAYYSFFPTYNYDAAWRNGFTRLRYAMPHGNLFSPINMAL